MTPEFVEALDSLSSAVSAKKFVGYLQQEIPHELDALPGDVVRSYRSAQLADRGLLLTLDDVAATIFRAFSERQAALAVRLESRDILVLSVLALGLAAEIAKDKREGMLAMPLPWQAATRLRQKPKLLFLEVAHRLPPVGRAAITAFADRDPANQTLACMGYVEGADAGGFRYVRTW